MEISNTEGKISIVLLRGDNCKGGHYFTADTINVTTASGYSLYLKFFFKSDQIMKCIYNAIITPPFTNPFKNIEKFKERTKFYYIVLSIKFNDSKY